jgi:hypothetical protein
MFHLPADPVTDEELEAVLEAALRASGGQLTRPAECWMATVVARHLADRLALAGLTVVRLGGRRLT